MGGFLTVGVSAALRQLLEFGLFHGDPHPGNIFVMRDGRIAYVDFGNVAVLSQVKYIEGRKFPRCNLLPFSNKLSSFGKAIARGANFSAGHVTKFYYFPL